jgi:hypothetical protein
MENLMRKCLLKWWIKTHSVGLDSKKVVEV